MNIFFINNHKIKFSGSTMANRVSQQAQDVDPMLFYYWTTVFDGGPALKKHRVSIPCLLLNTHVVFSILFTVVRCHSPPQCECELLYFIKYSFIKYKLIPSVFEWRRLYAKHPAVDYL